MGPATSILDRIGDTPLVPLGRVARGLPVYAKCEFLNPGGSVKDRIAVAIVDDAERRGALRYAEMVVRHPPLIVEVGYESCHSYRGIRFHRV